MAEKEPWYSKFLEHVQYLVLFALGVPAMLTAALGYQVLSSSWATMVFTLACAGWAGVAAKKLVQNRSIGKMSHPMMLQDMPLATSKDYESDVIEGFKCRMSDLIENQNYMKGKTFKGCFFEGHGIIEPEEDWPIHKCHWLGLPRWEMFQSKSDIPPATSPLVESSSFFKYCWFENIQFRMKETEIHRVMTDFKNSTGHER